MDGAGGNLQVDSLQGFDPAEMFINVPELNHDFREKE
jgi:hypothetical protein